MSRADANGSAQRTLVATVVAYGTIAYAGIAAAGGLASLVLVPSQSFSELTWRIQEAISNPLVISLLALVALQLHRLGPLPINDWTTWTRTERPIPEDDHADLAAPSADAR